MEPRRGDGGDERHPGPGCASPGVKTGASCIDQNASLHHCSDRYPTLRFSAEDLPRLLTTSYSTTCPSLSVESPAFSTAEIWTKTSPPPPWGWMKPNPFAGLNHFTVPFAIVAS